MNENVLRGIQLLDEKVPDWRDKINPETLDLADGCNCVLGQLFGSYERGLLKLKIMTGGKYGFNIPLFFTVKEEDEAILQYSKLAQLWLEILGEPS